MDTSSFSIAFIGECGNTRRSIIRSITGEYDQQTEQLSPRNFSFELTGSKLDLRLFDVDYEANDLHATQSDLIILVSSVAEDSIIKGDDDDDEEETSLQQWVERAAELKKPFVIVTVRQQTDEKSEFVTIEEQCPSLENIANFVGSFDFIQDSSDSTEELVFKLCEACLNPFTPLYDFNTQSISPRSVIALKRIFWIVDSDKDSFWNSLELNRFLRICGDSINSLEDVNTIVAREDASHVHESGLTFEGLVALVSQLIKHQSVPLVWSIFRNFDYDSSLRLDIEDMLHMHVPTCTVGECITLSEQGIRVLSDLFQKFDRNGDGLLSRMDLDEAFSITTENPFEKLSNADYMEMCETKKQMMTLNGWTSLWCLLTIRDPYTLLRTLVYWGIKRNLEKVLVVRKKRGYRDSDEDQSVDMPSTVQCYIFGAPRSGKSSLMRSFIQKPFNTVYSRTEEQYTVANKITFEDEEYYMTITEFEYGQVQTILASEDLMSQCDVCVLCFDGNDKYSFSTAAYVQRHLPRNMPVVYILTKSDLDIVDQEFDVTPQEFCQELQLPWPCIVSSLVKDEPSVRHQNFQEIVASAIYPDIALPSFDAEDGDDADDDGDDEDINDGDDTGAKDGKRTKGIGSSLFKAVIAMGTVAVLGAITWRFLKSKNTNTGTNTARPK